MEVSSRKRKDISDFFLPLSKRAASATETLHSPGKSRVDVTPQLAVPGLEIQETFVTAEEETRILDFLNDPDKCTWRTDLSRRTMHFGGTYCLMPPRHTAPTTTKVPVSRPEILQAPPMPAELDWLLDRFATRNVFAPAQRPQYCIVNEYTGRTGISAHIENVGFAEPVVGLSLLQACPMRFIELTKPDGGSVRSGKAAQAEKTGRKAEVRLPARSLMVMRGDSRWRWQHEIQRNGKGRGRGWKRISLTFRYKENG